MVGLSAFQYLHASDAGFFMSGLTVIGAALLSVALVIAIPGILRRCKCQSYNCSFNR